MTIYLKRVCTLYLLFLVPSLLLAQTHPSEGTVRADSVERVAYSATQQARTQMPRIENARADTAAVTGTLEATFQSTLAKAEKPEWVGYSVDEVPNESIARCGYWGEGCGTCRLEEDRNGSSGTKQVDGSIRLEGGQRLVVLLRLEAKRVARIRVASEDCRLDAGGLPFHLLTGVKPAESIALLTAYVQRTELDRQDYNEKGSGALKAIALHADASADRAMESFVLPKQPEELRKQAAFWLGAARGAEGLRTLKRMAKDDPSPDVRGQVTFALSVSHESGAIEEMTRMARDDSSSHVRGQALFWLGQNDGQKVVSTITEAIKNDPDTGVKKKAVFALSQLPKDEGVPKLIDVAQTNPNPAVRKDAIFWLGQSNDLRAVQFFEQVLTK